MTYEMVPYIPKELNGLFYSYMHKSEECIGMDSKGVGNGRKSLHLNQGKFIDMVHREEILDLNCNTQLKVCQ